MLTGTLRYMRAARRGAGQALQEEAGEAVARDIENWLMRYRRIPTEDADDSTIAIRLHLADIYTKVQERIGGDINRMSGRERSFIVSRLHKNVHQTSKTCGPRGAAMRLMAYFLEAAVRPGAESGKAFNECVKLFDEAFVTRTATELQIEAIGSSFDPVDDDPFR